jgi:hypothetical protein
MSDSLFNTDHARVALLPVNPPAQLEASTKMSRAFALLLEATDYAEEVSASVWDFAVEAEELRSLELSNNDMRWLVAKGYVEHAREIAKGVQGTRRFRPAAKLDLAQGMCFILTPSGILRARQSSSISERRRIGRDSTDIPVSLCWDSCAREFRFGDRLIKRFRVPAANQERILDAFQEEGWPTHIDDPLPPVQELDSKRRLHDTINRLNRNQKDSLVRFHGDGRGQGVHWEFALPTATRLPPDRR